MAIELIPRARIEPVPSQTGGVNASVVPMQDRSAGNLLAIGEGGQDLARALTVLADRKQDNIDRGVSLDSRNFYSTDAKNEMAGPGGFMHTLGKDANDERWKQHKDRLRLSRQKIEKTLQNDAQRLNFKEHADRLDLEIGAQAAYHQAVESQKFAAGSTAADADQKIDRAIDLVGTEEGEVAHAEAMAGYDKWADLVGLEKDDPIVKKKKQDANDRLHSAVIDRLVTAEQPDLARQYLGLHQGEVSPEKRTSLQRTVEAASVDQQAQDLAVDLESKGDSLLAQISELDKRNASGELPISVVRRTASLLEDRAKLRRSERALAEKSAVSDAIAWRMSGSPLTPQMHEALVATNQLWKLEAWEDSGGGYHTTGHGWRELHTATDEELLRFNNEDEVWDNYRTEMDNEHLADMVAKWRGARARAGKAAQEAESDVFRATFSDAALYHFRRLPEVPDDLEKVEDEFVPMFSNWEKALRDEANRIARKSQGMPHNEIIDAAADSLMKPGRVKPLVDGEARTLGTLLPSEREAGKVMLSPSVAAETGMKSFDMNLATPERLQAADAELRAELQRAGGLDDRAAAAIVFDEQALYNKAAEMVAGEGRARRAEIARGKQRGYDLMGQNVRRMYDDREVGRRMMEYLRPDAIHRDGVRPGAATPRKGLLDFAVASVAGENWKFSSDVEANRTAFVSVAMDMYGSKLAADFGISDAEMRSYIRNAHESAGMERIPDTPANPPGKP